MNISDELDTGKVGKHITGFKNGIMWKLYNGTDPGCLQVCVGDCDKVGRESFPKEWPARGTHNGTYNAVICPSIRALLRKTFPSTLCHNPQHTPVGIPDQFCYKFSM